jgi:hypothetical protein
LKSNAKIQAKMRRVIVETREEKLIPKASGLQAKKEKRFNKKSTQQLLDSDEEDSDSGFKTKLDPEEEKVAVKIKTVKNKTELKRKREAKAVDGKRNIKNKLKKQKLIQPEFEAQDELVDLELSD